MDNLIAEKKAKPMIIVMDNLNAVKPGDSATIFAGRGLVPDPSDHPAPPPAARGEERPGARTRTRRARRRRCRGWRGWSPAQRPRGRQAPAADEEC